MEQEKSVTDEPACIQGSSGTCISKLDSDLLEDVSTSEVQKLRHVASWTELFLDQFHTEDNRQEKSLSSIRSVLHQSTENSRDKDTLNEVTEKVDLKQLHAHVSNRSYPFVFSENKSEHTKRWTSTALLTSKTLFSSRKSFHPSHTIKNEGEGRGTVVSISTLGECEVDIHMRCSTTKSNCQDPHIVCKTGDLCATTLDSNENVDMYFWAPLNDSSDDERPNVLTEINSTKLPATETKEDDSPLSSVRFFRPETMKCFPFAVLEGNLPSTSRTNSSEKWNPKSKKFLEIKEHKYKDFRQSLKADYSNAKSISEQVTNTNITLDPKSKVKKDAPRDRIEFQSPETEQSNETDLAHVIGRVKIFEEKKCNEEQANSSIRCTNCKIDQRKRAVKCLIKDPTTQGSSFCSNAVLKPSEQSSYKVGPDNLKLDSQSTNWYSNQDSGLQDMSPQFSDNRITPKASPIPKCMQDYENECDSEKVIKPIIAAKTNSEEFSIPRVNVGDQKKVIWYHKFLSDSNHHDSVLSKYYYYLNYLNESKRIQDEDSNSLFSCQELHGFSEKLKISSCSHCTSNICKLRDSEEMTSEITCHKEERVVKQQESYLEEQEAKSLIANICSKPLTDHDLTDAGEGGNLHISKGKKIHKTRKVNRNVAGCKRYWKSASSIALSSYSHGELKSRLCSVQRPAPANKSKRKDIHGSSGYLPFNQATAHPVSDISVSNKNQKKIFNYQDKSCFLKTTNAWTDFKQQQGNAFKSCEEINMKNGKDSNVSPWLLLPDELWICIFSFLAPKDISRVSQVCHRFYQIAGEESFWREIYLLDCRCLNDDWFINLGKRHPQHFTLDHCHGETKSVTDAGLKQFFQHCSGSLMELNLKNCSGPGLRGDTVLLHASTFCNHLTTVDVSWTGASDSGLIALVKASIRLQSLSANGCQITDDAVATLVKKHGKSLGRLEIFGCYAVTAKCIRAVAVKCPNLKILNIGRVHKVTEDCLAKIVNSMKTLTSLNVTGLHSVRDHVVHYIVKKCPELKCLVLSSCTQATDTSLMEICTYLPTISYIDVSGCKNMTDIGVQALARRCHKLSYLDLSSTATSKRGDNEGHQEIVDALCVIYGAILMVCLLANFCFRTLEYVKLSFCKNITLHAIAKLCKNCKRLKILHLYGCHFVPDLESIKKISETVEVFHDLPAAKLSSE